MVDFNTETAINTPAKSIEGVLLLEKREAFLQAKESYNILKFQGSTPQTAVMRARLINLIDQWHGYLKRQANIKLDQWIETLQKPDVEEEDIMKIFYEISEQMDISKLTRIDIKVIDTTDIELENDLKGLD